MQVLSYDFRDIVSIFQQRNGRFKFDFRNKEGNIYKTLHLLGYCRAKIGKKYTFYHRSDKSLTVTNIEDIKKAFTNYLQSCKPTTLPEGVILEDVLNALYDLAPIKQNSLFEHYLYDNPTEKEVHELRLQYDFIYRRQFDSEWLLKKFEEWQLNKSVDALGSFAKNTSIYFKKIERGRFLVFNLIRTTNDNCIFDCSIAKYRNDKDFNFKKPIQMETIVQGFKLDRDFKLIQNYIEA